MKKRIVSFLMALVMAVSLLPVSAFAVEDGVSPKESSKQNESIEEPSPISTYANETYYPTITYTIDGKKVDYTTSSKDSIGQWKEYATALNSADIFVVSIPAGAEIDSITIPNSESNYVGLEIAGSDDWMDEFVNGSANYPTLSEIREKVGLVSGTAFRVADDSDDAYGYAYNISELDEEIIQKIPAVNVEGYMLTCYIKYSQFGPCIAAPGIIVQYASGDKSADTTELANEVARVTGENVKNWHQTNDKWNGKTWSEKGFWNELTAPLAIAQELVEKGGSELAVKDATAALQAAIGNLISKSNVNATALYEALNTKWCWYGADHTLSTAGDPVSADNCTFLSWQPYAKALKDAQALLDTLYENGKPTDENTASKQGEVDKLAAAADAHKLVNKEAYAAAYDKYMAAKPEAEALLQQYDPAKLTESDYTADSWKTYTDAYAVLEADVAYRIVGGTFKDWEMLQGFNGYNGYDGAGQWTHFIAHIEALKNAYRALTSGVDVTVSFTYINNFSALYPGFGGTSLYANSSLPLAAGSANLLGAYNAANIELDTHDDTSLPGYYYANTGDTNPRFLVFINGSCAGLYIWSSRNSTLYPQHALSAVQLHNGDSVKMVRVAMPQFNKEDSSGLDSSKWNLLNASEEHYQSSVALIDMTAPGSAKVGDKATFSATVTEANTTNLGSGKSAAGITLFISDPSETEALSQPIHKTAAATGADGSLQYVFTKPGWYTVAMFNVTARGRSAAADARRGGRSRRAAEAVPRRKGRRGQGVFRQLPRL